MSEWGIGMATLEMTGPGDDGSWGWPTQIESHSFKFKGDSYSVLPISYSLPYLGVYRIGFQKTTTNLTDLNSTSIHGEHFLHTIVIDVKLTA